MTVCIALWNYNNLVGVIVEPSAPPALNCSARDAMSCLLHEVEDERVVALLKLHPLGIAAVEVKPLAGEFHVVGQHHKSHVVQPLLHARNRPVVVVGGAGA